MIRFEDIVLGDALRAADAPAEWDIERRRAGWEERPMLVAWEMTRACGLSCSHCRAAARQRRHPLELSTEEARSFLDQVARAAPRILILTGGDPMLRRDLEELISYGTTKGLNVVMSPAATARWLGADLPALRQAGLRKVSISLDGANEETQDRIRGIPGTWVRTMLAIEAAKDAGLGVQINTTITRHNLGEFEDFVLLLSDLELDMWSLFILVPTGRADSADMVSGAQLEELFGKLADLSGRVPYAVKTTEGPHFRRVMLQRGKVHGRTPGMQGVGDGRGFVFVSHIGEICPSGFLPMVEGNVRTDDLLEVYQNSPLFRSLRDPDQLKGKCRRCEFRGICGGSRARAYAATGDPLAEEPLCIYQPAARHKTKENLQWST